MGLAHSPSIVRDGLVLYLDAANPKSYPASGTTWKDISGNGSNRSLQNGVGFDSATNGSMTFDGSNDFVDSGFGNSVDPSVESLSFEIWLKPNNPSESAMYFAPTSHGSSQRAYFATNQGRWRMGINNSAWSSGNVPVENKWTFITGVFDSLQNKVSLYVNSSFSHSKNYSSYTFRSNFQIGRGGGSSSPSFYFDGNISNVQIYNRALTESEIKKNFEALRGRYGV